jgi:hypothetical protein
MLLGTGVTNGNLRPDQTCAGWGFFLPICRCCQSWAIVVPFGPHCIGPLTAVGHENLGTTSRIESPRPRRTRDDPERLVFDDIDLNNNGHYSCRAGPKIAWGGDRTPSAEQLDEMHQAAHENCFISNSVKTEVTVTKL